MPESLIHGCVCLYVDADVYVRAGPARVIDTQVCMHIYIYIYIYKIHAYTYTYILRHCHACMCRF